MVIAYQTVNFVRGNILALPLCLEFAWSCIKYAIIELIPKHIMVNGKNIQIAESLLMSLEYNLKFNRLCHLCSLYDITV